MATKLTLADWHHILQAFETCEAEFEELMLEREWYVTDVIDHIKSAKEIVTSQIKENK